MIQGWTKRKRRLVVGALLGSLVLLWMYLLAKAFINEENLKLRGVVVKAKVVKKETMYYKNASASSRYTIAYLYGGQPCSNVVQDKEHDANVGDSVSVKIDSKCPQAYCELVY